MNQVISRQSTYRAEIDGLRAFAVLSVVMFHAFPSWLKGGFIGVDIFFVISGFLITSYIFEKLDQGTLSFSDFFGRRIRRIFPALVVVMAVSLMFGWFVLLSGEYAQLGKHITRGAGFILNFALVHESGYFDNVAETKPMLHLWSLSVEEQFYIIWPLVLWSAWKLRLNLLSVSIFSVVISFLFNLYFVGSKPVHIFFWPVGRFWELLSGSILAWLFLYQSAVIARISSLTGQVVRRFVRPENIVTDSLTAANLASLLGLTILVYGVVRINEDLSFPGIWAIIPVVGALFVIGSGSKAWLNRVFLMNPIAVWIGVISYPLYLWHWVILSFLHIIEGEMLSNDTRILAVSLSIILAWMTYLLVEKPIRSHLVTLRQSFGLGLSMIFVACIGYSIQYSHGYPDRDVVQLSTIKENYTQLGMMSPMVSECGLEDKMKKEVAACFRDQRGPIRYAMIGDSKAAALIAGAVRTSTESGRWLMIGGNSKYGSPSPFMSNEPRFRLYQPLLISAINSVSAMDNVNTIVLVGAARILGNFDNDKNWLSALKIADATYEDGRIALANTVRHLVKADKKVVLVVDNPALGSSEFCGERIVKLPFIGIRKLNTESADCRLKLVDYYRLREKYIKALSAVSEEFGAQVAVFDTADIFCDVEHGVCLRYKNGKNSFAYTDHISDYMAGLIGEKLNQFLAEWSVKK
ncbi:acyltransferase family protein [Vibrio mangrovi]|uniref:Acyltransferase family protein n=1 Tax=Vibrio mangrovi TaxID=474394 RepID=A0A1Y6IT53_9VIBR|nr:acyltransferase family protein [Vibrio mangrovi]MDW6003212.1 acyltransferase family protein [Vibrio mangrovi]SMS00000.1 O-acetyltransferase OatA [Vibrio mangrovi]